MGRGRPRSLEFLRVQAEFIQTVRRQLRVLGKTQTWLAKHTLVPKADQLRRLNKGTLSEILSGQRVASLDVLQAIMKSLEFAPDLVGKFAWEPRSFRPPAEPNLISDYNYPRAQLLSAVTSFVRGFYPDGYKELRLIVDAATKRGDLILEADAAARIAWLLLEIGEFEPAEGWAKRSIAKSVEYLRCPLSEIILSAETLRPADRDSQTAAALRTLSDALHLRSQILASQILYLGELSAEEPAREALERSLELDRRLDLAEPTGNDLRWKAVVEATGNQHDADLATRLIDQSKSRFARGGLYEAHLVNAQGIIHLGTRKWGRARDLLTEAKDRLSSFADSRGLALTMYLLSDTHPRPSDNRRLPFRQMVAAAALHPYGFILDRGRALFGGEKEFQKELDNLLAGTADYLAVHQMLDRLAKGSSYTGKDLLYRNIDLMLGAGFPHVRVPFRRSQAIRDAI